MLTKSRSCNEIQKRSHLNTASTAIIESVNGSRKPDRSKVPGEQHKTVIYFGDTIANRRQHNRPSNSSNQNRSALVRNASNKSEDFQHARRLCEEMVFKRQYSIRQPKSKLAANRNCDNTCGSPKEHAVDGSKSSLSSFKSDQSLVIKELKSVVEVKLKNQLQKPPKPPIVEKPIVPQKIIALPQRLSPPSSHSMQPDEQNTTLNEGKRVVDTNRKDQISLPSFVESVTNGVINIKIDGSFGAASKLAESLGRDNNSVSEFGDNGSDLFLDVGGEVNNVYFDWSFVQDWRSGPIENAANNKTSTMDRILNANNLRKSDVFLYQLNGDNKSCGNSFNKTKNKSHASGAPMHPIQPQQMQKGSEESKPTNGAPQYSCKMIDIQEGHSSSEENRSSGHASMSENGLGSTSPGHTPRSSDPSHFRIMRTAYPPDDDKVIRLRTNSAMQRHRPPGAKPPWKCNEIKDIKSAIRQLTMDSRTSGSTYSSHSADSAGNIDNARGLNRDFSSVETINTNVTSAEEFVWVDSRNRLVELQNPPWNQHSIVRVLRQGRCRGSYDRISPETVPRLGYLLQRALVRVAREMQRLSMDIGFCSKNETTSAFKIVLCPALADSCNRACLRAAAMFGIPGDCAFRQSKSARAGLQLPVGRFHRWMCDARLGRFVHEYAAVYLTAGMENLLEEIVLQCLPIDENMQLTAIGLEHAIANNGDIWGLLQSYAHLNAGRIASGALAMPRLPKPQSLIGCNSSISSTSSVQPCLLTTCVGSIAELIELIGQAQGKCCHCLLSHAATNTLFYFMRCSQLERNESHENCYDDHDDDDDGDDNSVQELCYERAYVVLPPLIEWLRVTSAHAEHRQSSIIDKDDVMQAARLLLPGLDCPPRPLLIDEDIPMRNRIGPAKQINDIQLGFRASVALAFKFLLSGKSELMQQALAILPPTTRYDTMNEAGLTALMIASIRNDEVALQMLLDVGVNVNIAVPALGTPGCPAIHPETPHWTALTFAACRGHHEIAKTLLARGARVEGGLRVDDGDTCTMTPLQLASSSGTSSLVTLLLNHRANPFLSTMNKDSLFLSAMTQCGSYSAISVSVAHDNEQTLHKLLSHPMTPASTDILSLEEMLAEDVASVKAPKMGRPCDMPPKLTKMQIKCFQEAMYHSAENNHLHIIIELRSSGVPWTLHCWMHALAAAHELQLDDIIDQLLHDFLEVCPDDYSTQFIFECLPLLFNIFRCVKKEGTILLLADIFATCFGWEAIKPIKDPVSQPVNGSRIDLKFVNNPELSDVMFRVEGKIFYAHKIVLVTASARFQNLLSSKLSDGGTKPTVQINDIRYHIFQHVMQFLYSGGCNSIDVATLGDLLELMAAASFFQLHALLRYTEARCSQLIDSDNIVTMYIHAKVYNAAKLLEFCQGYLLQNIVTLLNYDESVKRLLFAKKVPNHDVLHGLLLALQARIEYRYSAPNSIQLRRFAEQNK